MADSAASTGVAGDGNCVGCARADRRYAKVDGVELAARVYRPVTRGAHVGSRPAIVHAVGGGWMDGGRDRDAALHRMLANAGIVSVVPDLRGGPSAGHPAAQTDYERAVLWAIDQAEELGIDPARLVLAGSWSGAHAALCVAATSTLLRRRATVRAVVLRNPCLDPLTHIGRIRARVSSSPEERMLVDSAEQYFGTLERMRRAGLPELVFDGGAAVTPDIVMTRSSTDAFSPAHAVDELAYAWRRAGGQSRVLDVDEFSPTEIDDQMATVMQEALR